jgi:hypothetical protein
MFEDKNILQLAWHSYRQISSDKPQQRFSSDKPHQQISSDKPQQQFSSD